MAVTDKTQIQLDLLSLKKVLSEANKSPKSGQKDNRMMYTFSQGISSMNTHLEDNNALLTKMNKSISDLSHGMMMSQKGQAKDLTRKKDPFTKLVKELNDLEKLQMEEMKYQKAKDKKSKMGLLGMFGLLLGAGGLLGFLMTGKTEFLHSLIKSFTKYSPLKFFIGILDKGLKAIGEPLVKGIGKIFKPIAKIFEGVGGIFGKLGGIFGKGAIKEGSKLGGKTAGKSFLKKIPFIGSVMGLIFGIQRFKKGDWLGGALEIASGITSIIPGAGIPLGIAIDAFLLFRDFAGKDKVDKGVGKVVTKTFTKGLDAARKMPVIGVIIQSVEAMAKFATDPIGAVKDIIGVADTIFPGLGDNLLKGIEWVAGLKDWAPVKAANAAFNKGKEIFNKGKEVINDVKNSGSVGAAAGVLGKAALGGAVALGKAEIAGLKATGSLAMKGATAIASGAKKAAPKVAAKAIDVSKGAISLAENVGKGAIETGKKVAGSIGQFLNIGPGVDISGVKPDFWNNFTAMIADYGQQTGRTIPLNSAFRSYEQQQYFWDKYGHDSKRAARPGNSLHEYGLALDVGDKAGTDTDQMAKMGLLDKYGFMRPLPNEKWHLTPKGVPNKYALPKNEQRGVGESDPNMPSVNMPPRIGGSGSKGMDLSESTIALLAKEIGKQFAASRPIPKTPSFNVSTAGRG